MTGDTAQPLARPKAGSLGLRVVSAAVLLPVAVVTVWLGSWWLAVFLACICAAMCWEWANLCNPDRVEVWSVMVVAGAVGPLALVLFGFWAVVWVVMAALAALGCLAVLGRLAHPGICIAGTPYVVVGISCIGWLRTDPDAGMATVYWAATSIIATDVGAYFTGRAVGGPKLAPTISPNKTWSGLIGGMAGAAIVGVIASAITEGALIPLTLGSIALAVISQGGDLIESNLKRKFNVKDASRLIPGHGGFLDRFDGYLTAMPAAALMSALAGGSPVTWQ